METIALGAAERAARMSYSKLLAILVARSRDIALCEDALSDAFAKALTLWPERGVPANPDAWLLTAARHTILNLRRHDRVRGDAALEIIRRYEDVASDAQPFADERLKLMLVCAHPAIAPDARAPLMLQTVLGLDAARICKAFLITPATMSQRLVRAKTRIRDAGIRFDVPEPEHLRERLADVLDAIYTAFGTGWEAGSDQPAAIQGLPDEAIYLGRLIVSLAPDALGLLSLMLFSHARRMARRTADGAFVPLSRQDASVWDRDMIIEAEALLVGASRFGQFGRYQCEAAIQSVHAQRAITGRLNLDALKTLYGLLVSHHPTIGGFVALASVLRAQGRPQRALDCLDGIEATKADYQPYWVLRAHCERDIGDAASAVSLEAALRLTADAAIRRHLCTEFEQGRTL